VRPSASSLNSLAEMLRQAQPLYCECRSILDYLDREGGIAFLPVLEDSAGGADRVSANKDAHSLPQSILEPMALNQKRIM
jgi:hypothetical protein